MRSREMNWLSVDERKIVKRHTLDCPVKLGSMAKELGVVIKVASLNIGLSGQIKREDNQYVIRVNRYETRERQRFTIAHELSHFLLHRNFIDSSPDGIEDNVLYRSGAPERNEYEANRLAADILMPREHIERTLRKNFKGVITEATIESLAASFQVSRAEMEIRLSSFPEG